MKAIKILLVIDSLSGGGAEKMVTDLALHLNKRKYQIFLCSLTTYNGPISHFNKQGIKVFILNKKRGFDPSAIIKIYRILKKERIDILHTHLFSSNFYGRTAGIFARTPILIANEHSLSLGFKTKKHLIIDKILSLFTNKIIAVSNAVKKDCVTKQNLPNNKLLTIYNGVDPSKFDFKSLKHKKSNFVLGYFGRFVPVKNLIFLLSSFVELKKEHPKLRLLLAGEGPTKQALEIYAQKNKISSSIVFKNWRKNIAMYYQMIDVFVLPSYKEGFSLSVLEAMALGIPVVLTDVGGNSEAVLNNETGFLFPVNDSSKFCEIINNLIYNPSLRKEVGQKGKERVKSFFSLNTMIKEYESLYDNLIIQL